MRVERGDPVSHRCDHAGPRHASSADLPPATGTQTNTPGVPHRPPPLRTVAVLALACACFVVLAAASATPAWAAAASKAVAAAKSTAVAASASAPSNPLHGILSFVLHLDKHLSHIITTYGTATYAILWAIVFCETGVVVLPFLPGDSLLFATGALAGMGKLAVGPLVAVYLSAAVLGDAVNYAIGSWLGRAAIESGKVKREYVQKTEGFYAKHGAKTVVLARFVPIVRTFAPFVAGVGSMEYREFATYNVLGAVVWTALFVGAGFTFGNLPAVQHNFTLVVLAIIAVSVLPVVWEIMQARKEAANPPAAA